MVKYIKDRSTKKEILKSFEPLVRKWFNEKFNDLTPPQAMAVPLIKNKENGANVLGTQCVTFLKNITCCETGLKH